MLSIIDVNVDRSEMLLQVSNGKAVVQQKLASDAINRIEFGSETVKSWFSSKSLPKLEIYLKGREEPLVLQSKKGKAKFEQDQVLIRQFAVKFQIPLEE